MSNRHTVLLIEDNPGDADLVRLRLVESESDVEVRCVDRLSAGLQHLGDESPTLVLLDLNLPDSHGAETFRKILSKAPGVPVVVLSGQDDEELALKAVHQGVQDYLVKGEFNSTQLARAMRYAIERQALLTSLDISRRQQLEFKNQFLSHVSHELRTPLTCIHQFVTLMLDGLTGPLVPQQTEHLETVLRSTNQLRSMIGDLLEATRVESGKIRVEPQCIAIGEVIHQVLSMLRASAQNKEIGLEIGVDTRIPLAFADADRMLQVLTNLLDNAIKFTAPGGSIMVKAFLLESDPDFVYISVSDTGRGINPEVKAMIFERLYQEPGTIDDSRKGLGLGLYITREIVSLHGGRIWVESEPGHGSTFTFTLPLFSLAKLLLPAVVEEGKLRSSLSLITVELTPLSAQAVGNWRELRRQCLELLRSCILADKDLLLPTLGIEKREAFLILAAADLHGTEVITERIREQIMRSPDLQGRVVGNVSAVPIALPTRDSSEPIEKQVQEVADSVTELVMAVLLKPKNLEQKKINTKVN
ncbi:MAG TPA: ATP-binding protein [Terriglobales bacterium]